MDESAISSTLDANEHLIWSGRPREGFLLRKQDFYLIPFSLMWGGFAIFWEFSVLKIAPKAQSPTAEVFPLFGIPFVAIGLYIMFGRFFVDAYARSKTTYGVTSDRIVIVSGIFSKQTKSLQLRTLSDVSLTEGSNGFGTITFGPTGTGGGFFPGNSWPNNGRVVAPAFEMIDRAKDVYDIIRGAQKKAS